MPGSRYRAEDLERWVVDTLRACGVRAHHAASTGRVLLAADVQGIDSHGVARFPAYVDLLQRGAVETEAEPEVVRTDGATSLIDANNVMGHPAAELAMQQAVDLATTHGTGWVAVRNSNHYGIAGYYVRQAAEAGLVALCGTNAGARVAPAGARRPFLGTNPIALAAPTTKPPTLVFDMATSAVSTGKVELAAREGRPMPEGWGVDREGRPTNDPLDVPAGGWLLPLGSFSHLSDHKGSGLALVVEVLSAVLVGGAYGPGVKNLAFGGSDEPAAVSHFFCAIDPGRFGADGTFTTTLEALLRDLRALPPADAGRPVCSPGELEWACERDRTRHGVPLLGPVVDCLREVARSTGTELPAPLS